MLGTSLRSASGLRLELLPKDTLRWRGSGARPVWAFWDAGSKILVCPLWTTPYPFSQFSPDGSRAGVVRQTQLRKGALSETSAERSVLWTPLLGVWLILLSSVPSTVRADLCRSAVEQRLTGIILRLERQYSSWQRQTALPATRSATSYQAPVSRSATPSTEPSGSLTRQMLDEFYELWEASGHCEFGDMKETELVANTPHIVARYRRLLAKYKQTPWSQVQLDGLDHNVELLQGEYCWPALAVIQRQVSFDTFLIVSGRRGVLPIPKAVRSRIHTEMHHWLLGTRSELSWDPLLQCFTRKSVPGGFPFPSGVLQEWRTEVLKHKTSTRPSGESSTTIPRIGR
jgi:hypothetical protein